jgi:sugar phosphate isomerase/epimerase
MIKLGANTVLFAGYDLDTALKHIAWAGYDGAELSAIQGMCEHLELDNWKSQVADIKALAEKYELELTAMEEARLDEERLMKAYEAAAAIGIPVVNVGPGGKAGSDEDLDRQIDLLAKMSEKAHEHGVRLCVKAHVGNCIHDTPTTLTAMERIDSPGFGIDMDPSHIYRADGGEDVVEALGAVVSRMGHVHIRDCPAAAKATEGPPGKPEEQACGRGGIDLFGYIRVLHEAQIDIAVNLEVIGAAEYELSQVATIAAESRGYLNACLKACGARQ